MTPQEQYRRYKLAHANPASNPDSQLARRLKWQRELNEKERKAIRDQLALQKRQGQNIAAKVTQRGQGKNIDVKVRRRA